MTVRLWRIATDAREYEAHDLTGRGAEITGGRWNRKGLAVVYAASNVSLACLETVVHLGAASLPMNRCLVEIQVPNHVWSSRAILKLAELAVGWDAVPEGKVSLDIGDDWLKKGEAALLEVPSVIVPEECNVLINPRHPDAAQLKAAKVRRWTYDGRLLG